MALVQVCTGSPQHASAGLPGALERQAVGEGGQDLAVAQELALEAARRRAPAAQGLTAQLTDLGQQVGPVEQVGAVPGEDLVARAVLADPEGVVPLARTCVEVSNLERGTSPCASNASECPHP